MRAFFEHALWHEEHLSDDALALIGGAENLPLEYRLTLVVVNQSEQATVYVRDLYIERAAGDEGVHLTRDEEQDTRLEPHQRISRHVLLSQSPIQRPGSRSRPPSRR